MLQCLEWEPSGSFYQKHHVERRENGVAADHSVTSGLIDVNLMADMTDPNLPSNPKKVVLHRPPVTQLMVVIATVCEELPANSVMLLYMSAAGSSGHCSTSQTENYGIPKKSSLTGASANNYNEQRNGFHESHITTKGDLNQYYENYSSLGPSRNGVHYNEDVSGVEVKLTDPLQDNADIATIISMICKVYKCSMLMFLLDSAGDLPSVEVKCSDYVSDVEELSQKLVDYIPSVVAYVGSGFDLFIRSLLSMMIINIQKLRIAITLYNQLLYLYST